VITVTTPFTVRVTTSGLFVSSLEHPPVTSTAPPMPRLKRAAERIPASMRLVICSP
jgi:hypothetical protein